MSRLPTIFFGHGTPMIALQRNATTRAWHAMAQAMEKPRAILCISAHWMTRGIGVTAQERPPTIHDFGGFQREMFEIEYPAKSDAALIERVTRLLSPDPVIATHSWGYDHGTWTVLMKCWPDAEVPVVQLSLDATRTPAQHYAIGQRLSPLRDEGVLIMGSGNIVHNLGALTRRDGVVAHPLAAKFSDAIKAAILSDDPQAVIDYAALGDAARFSVPTPDHFWPLLYVLGARRPDDVAVLEPEFMQYGTIDMTSVTFR